MSILYRTPNIIIDRHEWCALVYKQKGRITLAYRFRPLTLRPQMWLPVTSWQGRKPKGLNEFFVPYRRHMALALESEKRREEAALAMEKRGKVALLAA